MDLSESLIYEPREDSELLLQASLLEVREDDLVLEIGAGSGYVAKRLVGKCKLVITTDISPYAVKVLHESGLNVIRTDIARGLKRIFTLVLFNPPYLEIEEKLKKSFWEDVTINGGKHGIEVISKFLDDLEDVMVEGGRAILIASSLNEPYIFQEIEKRGLSFEIVRVANLFFEKLYAIKIYHKLGNLSDEYHFG